MRNADLYLYVANQESTDLIREAHMGMGDALFAFLILMILILMGQVKTYSIFGRLVLTKSVHEVIW